MGLKDINVKIKCFNLNWIKSDQNGIESLTVYVPADAVPIG